MKIVRFVKYDVWGNNEDGYTVNDVYPAGSMLRDDYCPLESITGMFGLNAVITNDADYGDRDEIVDITNGKPLGAAIFEEEA